MSWFNSLKIGTKVALSSGLGIVTVLALVAANFVLLGNLDAATGRATNQVMISQLITQTGTDLQLMRVAARDIRLAMTVEKVQGYVEAADEALDDLAITLEKAIELMTAQANIDRANKLNALSEVYMSEVVKLAQIVASELAGGATQGVISAARQASAEKLLSISAEFMPLTNEAIAAAQMSVSQEQAEAAAASSIMTVSSMVLSAIVVVILVFSLFFVLRAVAMPIRGITERMQSLAKGDLEAGIPFINRGDEIGAMAAAVQVFQANALKVRELNDADAIRTGQTRERAAAMGNLMDGLADAVRAAIDGDFSQRIALSVPDEDLKAVANNVNELLSTVDAGVNETGKVLAALARTDLTLRMQGEYRGAFAKLKDDTNAVVDNLGRVVRQLRRTSGGLKSATGEILAGANDLAERTTKQAAAIEETSAAMEQLSSTVVENAKRAEQASSMAQSVSETAALTGQVMSKSNEAMERISSASSRISNIIGLIDDIAFQTNLLALNASVEAARAGDAGKGFAVVAVEVRRLAQSAAGASSEVKVLIEQSTTEVSTGSKLVSEATQRLNDMLGSVKESADLIKDISTASREQSNAISEVSTAIRQMDEMTQHNAALVEETNAAIEQTEAQANELDSIVEQFVVEAGTTRVASSSVGDARFSDHSTGIKGLQQKVRAAASSYLTKGNAALKQDWSEF